MPMTWVWITAGVAGLVFAGQIYLATRRRRARTFIGRLAGSLGTTSRGARIDLGIAGRSIVIDVQVSSDDRPEELRVKVAAHPPEAFRLTRSPALSTYRDSRHGVGRTLVDPLSDWIGVSEDPELIAAFSTDRYLRERIDLLGQLRFHRIEASTRELRVIWPGISWNVDAHDWNAGGGSLPARVRKAAVVACELAATLEAPTFSDRPLSASRTHDGRLPSIPLRSARYRRRGRWVFPALVAAPVLVMASGLAALILLYDRYPLLREEPLLRAMVIAGVPCALLYASLAHVILRDGFRRSARTAVLGVLAFFGFTLGSAGPLLWWNGNGPQTAGVSTVFEVVEIQTHSPLRSSGRGMLLRTLLGDGSKVESMLTTRRAIVRRSDGDAPEHGRRSAVLVTEVQAGALSPGARVGLVVSPGALGMAWYGGVEVVGGDGSLEEAP